MRYADARPLSTRPEPAAVASFAAASPARDPVMEMAAGGPPRDMATRPTAADVSVQSLPPITGSAISNTPIAGPSVLASTATSSLRIQAGAFSSEINAQRAVSQLSSAGPASIEPLQRNGVTLYRVVLPAPADEAAAYALRDRVADIGFAEARVVSSF